MSGPRNHDSSEANFVGNTNDETLEYPDKNVRELQLLANFYHKHGYAKEAEEIRTAIMNMRRQRRPYRQAQQKQA